MPRDYLVPRRAGDSHNMNFAQTQELGFTADYRLLRSDSNGSSQPDFNFNREIKRLNLRGSQIVFSLFDLDKRIAISTVKYLLDMLKNMQKVSERCFEFLQPNCMALFVIGNTEYRGMLASGFRCVQVTKRRISNKFLTPKGHR